MSVFSEAPRIAENELAFAVWDKYPMADGHCLICPKREVASWLEATDEEHAAMRELLRKMAVRIHPPGFRILINEGTAQHIPHVHMHLIPWHRDTP